MSKQPVDATGPLQARIRIVTARRHPGGTRERRLGFVRNLLLESVLSTYQTQPQTLRLRKASAHGPQGWTGSADLAIALLMPPFKTFGP